MDLYTFSGSTFLYTKMNDYNILSNNNQLIFFCGLTGRKISITKIQDQGDQDTHTFNTLEIIQICNSELPHDPKT